jgi:hypothetical protein
VPAIHDRAWCRLGSLVVEETSDIREGAWPWASMAWGSCLLLRRYYGRCATLCPISRAVIVTVRLRGYPFLMTNNEDSAPTPEPSPPAVEQPADFRHLEEARKGFDVMPTQPVEPLDFSRPIGGMPAPESPTPSQAPPPPVSSDSE